MGFRFGLETVLRLRLSLEDSERLRLQQLLADRAQLQRTISETSALRSEVGNKLTQSMKQEALPAAEMQFAIQRLAACDLQSARLQASVSTLAHQIDHQQAVLLRRRIDRKLLEQLRTQQLERHETEIQRREQLQMEELFLLRRDRKGTAISNCN